ncbi:hypothetical protein HYU91_03380 [Candidatus Collierbacteria bacterium]|nr:hypothetical protein [Candidatus Collierbacteria bacterium]
MSLKERFRELIDGPVASPGRRDFLRDMAIVVGGSAVLAACGAIPKPADNTTLPTSRPGGSPTPGEPDPSATATATNAPTQAETAIDQPTAPDKPPKEPPKEPTETPSPLETFGPVEVTGEEYKLLHTQNVVAFKEKDSEGNNIWEMIPPETYAARNEAVLEIRQRTIDKLAAEVGVQAPENNFDSYLAWLNQLNASGRIDGPKFWEYASNMPITNEEIKVLVENRTPENKRLAYPINLEPGLNYDASDKVYRVQLPDGTSVENKVPTRFMGKVLAVIPGGLLPGESVKIRGKIYVVLGDDDNQPFTIIAVGTSGYSYGTKNVVDYANNGDDVARMPKEWGGYYVPYYTGTGGPLYHKETFAKLGETEYQGGQTIKSLLLTADTWFRGYRLVGAVIGPQFHLDPNGVAMPVHDTVGYAVK